MSVVHIAVKSNDVFVLDNIMSKLGRLSKSVISPSLLAFPPEFLV